MSGDDIVERIMRAVQSCPCRRRPVMGSQIMGGCERCDAEQLVADEIERLRAERDASRLIISDLTAEVERLRAAGDALVEVSLGARPWITPLFAMEHGDRISGAIAAWEEARRER